MTSAQVVVNINIVTKDSSALNTVVSGLKAGFGGIPDPTAFAPVVSGFQNIVTTVAGDITAMGTTPMTPFDAAGQANVCTALTNVSLDSWL